MSEFRKDYVKNRWVAVACDRALKPNDFPIANIKTEELSTKTGFCPFCEGNEEYTPPEIAAYRNESQEPNDVGWLVRTIPNKFAAFVLQGELEERYYGIYQSYNGLGQHEVVIETPLHGQDFCELDLSRIKMIIAMLKTRYNRLAEDKRVKYIQIYKNRGLFGGASLGHSHSQIVGLPFVPGENSGITLYYAQRRCCLICDIVKQELCSTDRLVYEGKHFVVVCPYASRFAYETWIIPKCHTEHFGDISVEEEEELAILSKGVSMAICEALGTPSYNFVINNAPLNTHCDYGYHWYMEFYPRLLVTAGVEIATGIYINPVSPELATPILRAKMKVK